MQAIIKQGPYGLIRIETSHGTIHVNQNGMFSEHGKAISTATARLTVTGEK